jgi:hypothetical protein
MNVSIIDQILTIMKTFKTSHNTSYKAIFTVSRNLWVSHPVAHTYNYL